MYPFLRLVKEFVVHRNDPPLPLDGAHVSWHRCWPWDIDPWMDLNNGRTLTLYDLGRVPMAGRVGLIRVLREKGWGLTVAGAAVRYRRRILAFQKFRMQSRVLGWDHRFFYIDQSMWRGEDCMGQVIIRAAVTGKAGIVPPGQVREALGQGEHPGMALPGWVQAWIAAEDARPWPPERLGGA